MMIRLAQLFLRLLPIPACSAILGNVHAIESIYIMNGFSILMFFFILIYLMILVKKVTLEEDLSKKAEKQKTYLFWIEIGMAVFSLVTIMMGYYSEYKDKPHNINYYWGYLANFVIFLVCEFLSRLGEPGKRRAVEEDKTIRHIGKSVKKVKTNKKTLTTRSPRQAKVFKAIRPDSLTS